MGSFTQDQTQTTSDKPFWSVSNDDESVGCMSKLVISYVSGIWKISTVTMGGSCTVDWSRSGDTITLTFGEIDP